MAEQMMEEIADGAEASATSCARSRSTTASGASRSARPSVVIAVSAPPTAPDALAACKDAIDELKERRAALEERGLRGRRGMDRTGVMTNDGDLRDYDPIQPRGTDWRGAPEELAGADRRGRDRAREVVVRRWSSSATIFIAVGAYALIWGWKFGVGVVLLILVHETGPLPRGAARGAEPEAAGVHPVPRRVRAVHARQPVADRARRDRRPDPRRRRRARLLRDRPSRRARTCCSRSRTSASSSTCST